MALRTGTMDRRIELQERAVSTDSAGGAVSTWTTAATVWARVRPLTGRTLEAAQQRAASADTVFEIRHRASLPSPLRIVHAAEVYEPQWIDAIGRNEGIQILARRTRPAGAG